MTITNGYATLAEFKTRTALSTTDATRDAEIENIIEAVSRQIDNVCGRVFYSGSAGEVRYFTATSTRRCFIDDAQSVTALLTDEDGDETYETTWATTDYRLMPIANAFSWPYTWIEVKPYGDYSFPAKLVAGVKVTGTFGWAAAPDPVREACLIQSNRIWQRRNAPFGVLGANEFGAPTIITKLDPDVTNLLAPYVRFS